MSSKATERRRVLVMVHMQAAHARNILVGIGDYAEQHSKWQYQLEPHVHAGAIRRGNVDGMIVEARDPTVIRAIMESRIPIITVGHTPLPDGPPAVVVDNVAVGRMGAEHLLTQGYRHLAFVPFDKAAASEQRAAGFAEGARGKALSCDFCSESAIGNEPRLERWLKSLPQPVGIMAANDRMSLEVALACRCAGLRIPEQVALLGVDNESEICRLSNPPLSSIDHGSRRIGFAAASLLDQWMSSHRRPADPPPIVPVGVIARPSTDTLAVRDDDIVAAIQYIRAHVHEPTKVRDVMKAVQMSRRLLEIRFAAAVGRTVHQEIVRLRVERAKQLLLETDWSMAQISAACGIALPSQFSYVFRRAVGMPPLQFRKKFNQAPRYALCLRPDK
jgi:LacI family transcriptional regulator